MSNRKRRFCPPQKLNLAKRQKLSWDLSDATSGSSFVDPKEYFISGETERPKRDQTSSRGISATRESDSFQCKLAGKFPEFWHCVLGRFELPLCDARCSNVVVAESPHDSEPSVNMFLEVKTQGDHFNVDLVLPISYVSSVQFFQNLNQSETLERGEGFLGSFLEKEKLQALDYLQQKGLLSLVVTHAQKEEGSREHLEVAVCLHESGLTLLSHPSLEKSWRKCDQLIKLLMAWLYPDTTPTCLSQDVCPPVSEQERGFETLYGAVKDIREKKPAVHPTALLPANAVEQSLKQQQSCLSNDVADVDMLKEEVASSSVEQLTSHCQQQDLELSSNQVEPCSGGQEQRLGDLSFLHHADLLPTLRGYQRRAVQWMLGRELGAMADEQQSCLLHPLWRKCRTEDGKIIYFNPYTGRLTREKFPVPPLPCGGILADEMGLGKTVEVLALILNNPRNFISPWRAETDKMADHGDTCDSKLSHLPTQTDSNSADNNGQTEHHNTSTHSQRSEVMSDDVLTGPRGTDSGAVRITGNETCQCICGNMDACSTTQLLRCERCQVLFRSLCRSCQLCPNCSVDQSLVPSGATLIISPAPISQQWVEEITRHTRPSALKLLVYEGVAKQGFVHPAVLASYDIILTTYAVLRADLNHVPKGGRDRSMRFKKRYAVVPSPLTAIHFWRICLDEAQMVESTTAKAAEMALKLSCVHRWCVTGTPIQKGLDDLFGLLMFLRVSPYDQRAWWKTLLYEPYMRRQTRALHELLAKILWRSAKRDVLHEINLPEQTQKVSWLTFTPVEQHFYRRQHEDCSFTAHRMLQKWNKDEKLSSVDKHTVHLMLYPLLRLRQACCHPQVVRGGFLSMQKSSLTMQQLLDSLIAKAKQECEEAHRKLLFSNNGLAGVHIINEEWPEAVEQYRMVISSWRQHEAQFRTDALQKLHTLHNLALVLSEKRPGCSHTLRDDQLVSEAEELKNTYMAKSMNQVEAAQQNLHEFQHSVAEIEAKLDVQSPWWVAALQGVLGLSSDSRDELLHRVRDELSAAQRHTDSLVHRFSDIRGLEYVITTKLDMLACTHTSLVEAMGRLAEDPPPDVVRTAAECCLRPVEDSNATRCRFCEVDDIFSEYESRLFGHQGMRQAADQQDAAGGGNTRGLRAESETEKALRVILSFIKSHRVCSSVHQQAHLHLNVIEARRKEFKFLRAVWFALRERVSALDEVDMCTTRLRLLLPGEAPSNDAHVLHPLQVEQQRLKFLSDRITAQVELRKKLGQLLYLDNLAKNQSCHGGENPDPCPVCTKKLGIQWSVFSCGHCFCCQCAWVLLRQAGSGPRHHNNVRVKCPMCRDVSLAQEVSYVSTAKQRSDEGDQEIVVEGSHSTKVEAIVRTLLRIRNNDPGAKSLVFSTWQDVLDVISKGLDANGITYRCINGRKNFQENLRAFKQEPSIGVLLLPLQTGANGLNLVEASHVLLAEPALNPAHELQAVGRVHRIGQTRPTQVHRFIIRGTVESRMYTLLQSKNPAVVRTGSRDTENSALTVGDLVALYTSEEDWDRFPGDGREGLDTQP